MNPDVAAKFAALKQRLNSQAKDKARVDALKREAAAKAKNLTLRRRFISNDRLAELTGDLARDQAELARLRDDTLWTKECVVVHGQYQVCECCGHKAEATAGLYVREKHKTIPSAVRLKQITAVPDGLKIEVHLEGVKLQRCISCAGPNTVDDLLAACEIHGLHIHSQPSLFERN